MSAKRKILKFNPLKLWCHIIKDLNFFLIMPNILMKKINWTIFIENKIY